MSHMKLPTLVDLGLAIYISAAPTNMITIPATKLKALKASKYVTTKHTTDRKQGNSCKTEGCGQRRQLKGFCRRHGGVTSCTVDGCSTNNKGGGLCQAHGGGKRCTIGGCNKCAQRYGLCHGHGGTRICSVPDRTRSDRGSRFCVRHLKKQSAKSSLAA